MSKVGDSSSRLADFKQLGGLGEGAYSSVYKVCRIADGEIYALKKVKLPSLTDKEKQNALNEVRLLASIKHKNVIAYKEAFFDDQTRCLCIVTEYADGGDLFQQITKCQKERTHLREADCWHWLHGMCEALKALHDMRILHRDLKSANVFLTTLGDAKLGDFNVSKVAKRGLCMTQTGTPYYASPEVWRDMPYDAKSDMWSLGCVLYEMLALKPPFRAEDMEGLYRKVLRGQYPRIPAHYSQDLGEVVGCLLQVNPRHRPSVDQMLQMPAMRRHSHEHAGSIDMGPAAGDLLQTIKLPKNFTTELSFCLPKPQYENTPRQQAPGNHGEEVEAALHRLNMQQERGRGQDGPAMPRRSSRGSDPRIDGVIARAELLDKGMLNGGAHRMPQEQTSAAPRNRGAPRASALSGAEDSLDAYLAQPQQQRPPPAQPSLPSLPSLQPQPPHDALDAYLQRHHSKERQQRQDLYAGGPSPPVRTRLPRPDMQAERERGGGRGSSEAGSVAASLAPYRGDSPSVHSGRHRHLNPRSSHVPDRRQMASYARPAYELVNPPAQMQPKHRESGGGSALRLPRIFAKAN
eukprot:gnl/TRDRNA2_/TRDRNA2_48347_c0_seq1.p1 gnl/TRDRNA2_/TRDRNA2_48347_c0~~gnl/TRDRNA2_/TRDRNA2_48347_c0_seq1.p1  ORF type:complete len:576 (+),score=105.58 gnl/TRDRNA2_/TRDRNA2_48347_c0_seq1:106-1833(+)